MSIKYRGNSRDEKWRERQRQKQHDRQELTKKAEEESKTELQGEREGEAGVVETVDQGNPAEPGKTTEPLHG
jgi:hypothetical protein